MPFNPNFAIEVIWPAANAAYAIMSDPQPALPANYTLVGPIEAVTREAAPLMLQAHPNQLRLAHEMLAESPIFGLVAWNAVEKTALVALRGTKTIWEWIDDVDAVPVPYQAVPGAGLVHMGFQIVYQHMRANIARLLTAGCAGAQRMLITGHSLGAATALLAGVDLGTNGPLEVRPELHTLAGPRVGTPDFALFLNGLVPVCYRVVNVMDVVPHVPLPPLYEHAGQEEMVQGGFKPLDVTYAHHLTTYLIGLQKLAPAQHVTGVGV